MNVRSTGILPRDFSASSSFENDVIDPILPRPQLHALISTRRIASSVNLLPNMEFSNLTDDSFLIKTAFLTLLCVTSIFQGLHRHSLVWFVTLLALSTLRKANALETITYKPIREGAFKILPPTGHSLGSPDFGGNASLINLVWVNFTRAANSVNFQSSSIWSNILKPDEGTISLPIPLEDPEIPGIYSYEPKSAKSLPYTTNEKFGAIWIRETNDTNYVVIAGANFKTNIINSKTSRFSSPAIALGTYDIFSGFAESNALGKRTIRVWNLYQYESFNASEENEIPFPRKYTFAEQSDVGSLVLAGVAFRPFDRTFIPCWINYASDGARYELSLAGLNRSSLSKAQANCKNEPIFPNLKGYEQDEINPSIASFTYRFIPSRPVNQPEINGGHNECWWRNPPAPPVPFNHQPDPPEILCAWETEDRAQLISKVRVVTYGRCINGCVKDCADYESAVLDVSAPFSGRNMQPKVDVLTSNVNETTIGTFNLCASVVQVPVIIWKQCDPLLIVCRLIGCAFTRTWTGSLLDSKCSDQFEITNLTASAKFAIRAYGKHHIGVVWESAMGALEGGFYKVFSKPPNETAIPPLQFPGMPQMSTISGTAKTSPSITTKSSISTDTVFTTTDGSQLSSERSTTTKMMAVETSTQPQQNTTLLAILGTLTVVAVSIWVTCGGLYLVRYLSNKESGERDTPMNRL